MDAIFVVIGKSALTKQGVDAMEYYVFAETCKYFYLLFAPLQTLDFDKVVFNTESHPLKRSPLKQ